MARCSAATRTAFLSVFLLLSCALPAMGQTADWQAVAHPELQVRPTDQPVEIDGVLDEAAWREAAKARNFVEHQPGDQVQPPVATEAMLSYDDEFLYSAWICYDDPAQIRATFCERDRIWSDDYIILMLDTFGDQAWSYEIAVNPYGIQGDLLWSNGQGEDMTYDMVFYSAARITDEGWVVEMAIPWTSLRFPDLPQQEWRVDFWRNHPRSVRGQYSWAEYDRDEPCWPCQWGFVRGIEGVTPGSGLEILPAFVASQQSTREGDEQVWTDGDIKGEPSITASYGISPTSTVQATINPDFSQVESDAAQIDVNSTFALFYPEKRPFFQEGSDIWGTWFNAVYTRSINNPLFATKVTGRPGATNYAAMMAQDDRSPFILPFAEGSAIIEGGRSWSTLGRWRRTLGEGSHLGVIGTDRRHEGGGSGSTFGADWRQRFGHSWQFEVQAMASNTVEPDDPELTADLEDMTFDDGRHTAAFDGEDYWGHAFYGSVERDGRNWSFDMDYWERSPTFRAENGFEPRNDQRQASVWTGWMFYFEDSWIDRLQPQINGGTQWDFTGLKKDEYGQVSVWSRFNFAQTMVWARHMVSRENYGGLQYDGIWDTRAEINMRPTGYIDGGFEYGYGHRIARGDETIGRQKNVVWWVNLKPIDRLKLYQSYQHLDSDALDDGRELFSGFVARSRADLQVTRQWSLRLVLQYNDFARSWDADPLVTWRLNPFTIFYFGSTRHYADFDPNEDPLDGWRLTDRSYFLKFQYLFQL